MLTVKWHHKKWGFVLKLIKLAAIFNSKWKLLHKCVGDSKSSRNYGQVSNLKLFTVLLCRS